MPKKAEPQKKKNVTSIRLTDDEANRLQQTAAEMRIDQSSFIRGAIWEVIRQMSTEKLDPDEFYEKAKKS